MAEKSSILVFYLSLSKSNRLFRWSTIATLAVVNAAGFALLMTTVFQCRPVGAAFEVPIPSDAHCTDIVTIYLASAPVNIITDLVMLLLPMPILTGMRLPRKQKAILVITFGFGLFVAVIDIIRVAYLQSAATYRISELNADSGGGSDQDETDFSWYASLSFMWSAIEVNVGIMCACVPGLKPLVSRFMPHFIHDNGSPTAQRSSSDGHTAEMANAHRVPSVGQAVVSNRDFAPHEPEADSDMGMMDFLTTPGMTDEDMHNRLRRTDTGVTNSTRDTSLASPTWFDFVNIERKKSMVQMTHRESVFPFVMVTVLFFIWGFEYGLLNQLNTQFQTVAHDTAGQGVALHSAYFAGYLAGPLTFGRWILKRGGFRACFCLGLAIYACGTLVFWVAAVLTSFPTYVIVNFVVGMGLSTLEIAANPFIALCGPQEYAEIRLNLSQGFQAIGTVIAPLIAAKGFTKYQNDAPSLVNTQWAYLGIALFTVALAVAYFYIPLPETTEQELEDASERMDRANDAKVNGTRTIWIILGLGVFSQFCYVGGQETYGTTWTPYLTEVNPRLNRSDWLACAHGAFAASRFLSAGLGFFIKPRIQLMFFFIGTIVFSILSMNFTGTTAIAMDIMVFFFEGPIFSLIFVQCLRGMGKHTKDASVLLTAAISGGAVFPAISFAVTVLPRTAQYSLCVGLAAFAGGILLPLMLNINSQARHIVDPVSDPAGGSRPRSVGSNSSKVLSFFSMCPKKHNASKDGSVSWRERHGSGDTTGSSVA